jgi:hypothetical protein
LQKKEQLKERNKKNEVEKKKMKQKKSYSVRYPASSVLLTGLEAVEEVVLLEVELFASSSTWALFVRRKGEVGYGEMLKEVG